MKRTRDRYQAMLAHGLPRLLRSGLAGLLLVGSAACSSGPGGNGIIEAAVPFRHRVIDAHPVTGEDCCTDVCAVGDLNGDGYLDVVIGSEKAPAEGLVWYEYPLWERHAVAAGQFTTDGRTADIDGDGDQDIVTSNLGEGIFWYENTGAPDRWPARKIGPGYAHDLEVGDVSGNGRPEILTCDKQSLVLWHRARDDDAWSSTTLLTVEGEGIDLADVDGDADLDAVLGGCWLENPGSLEESWEPHWFAPDWPPETRARVADVNRDGRADIVLSASEGPGMLAWFEGPTDARQPSWPRHEIEAGELEGAHSLELGDLDGDGFLDVLTAEMHTSPGRRVLVYLQRPVGWLPILLSRGGSHNARLADIGRDGDLDVIGKNYAGKGRRIEIWENLRADRDGIPAFASTRGLGAGWAYRAIDSRRGDEQQGMMGLVFADLDADGTDDVIAGSIAYLTPSDLLHGKWHRTALPENADVYFHLDVDGDALPDLIGIAGDRMLWLEPESNPSGTWTSRQVATVPRGRTQGYAQGQIVSGGRPELVFTRGGSLLCLTVPDDARAGDWPMIRISDATEEEGAALGDFDRDGDLDIATHTEDGHHTVWFENPGTGSADWEAHQIGASAEWSDRIAAADVNGDGRTDVITSEETQGLRYDARVTWFEAPPDPRAGPWKNHAVTTLRSVNSMDVADLDGDGDPDLALAEHTDFTGKKAAPDNLTLLLYNEDAGSTWRPEVVEVGPHASHLGARLHDLDGDGDLDLVSLGWSQYRSLHLWVSPGETGSGRNGE